MNNKVTVLFVPFLMSLSLASGQQVTFETREFFPEDGLNNDQFGSSSAIFGVTAVIGSPADDNNGTNSGSAYVFNTSTGQQLQQLIPDDGAAVDEFGSSIAISGGTVVIGAPGDDDNGSNSGSVYLFNASTGQQIRKITPADGATNDMFGTSVAILGNTIVIGAPGDDGVASGAGSVYVFNTNGQQRRELFASDGDFLDGFGSSVGISTNSIVVGAFGNDELGSNAGSAYVFDVGSFQQLQQLFAADGSAGDQFGTSIAIFGNTAIVGAIGDDDNGSNSGSAYLFDARLGVQTAKLSPLGGAAGDLFGVSVGISGDTAVVGARMNDTNGSNSGSAYTFQTTNNGFNIGRQLSQLLPSIPVVSIQLGTSVAISTSNSIVVGAPQTPFGVNGSGNAFFYSGTPLPPPPPPPSPPALEVEITQGSALTFATVNEFKYILESSFDEESWTATGQVLTGDGEEQTFCFEPLAGQFFRVVRAE